MDVARLEESINTVQKTQADLISKMDQLDHSLIKFKEELLISQKLSSHFQSQLEDFQAIFNEKMKEISELLTISSKAEASILPSAQYKASYGDYLGGNWDLAIEGFENFVERYPKSILVPQAYYTIGECYYVKKDYNQARNYFDKVLSLSQELRPQALLKRSHTLEKLEQRENQRLTLETLVKEFPETKEAEIAQTLLEELSQRFPSPKTKSPAKPKKILK